LWNITCYRGGVAQDLIQARVGDVWEDRLHLVKNEDFQIAIGGDSVQILTGTRSTHGEVATPQRYDRATIAT